MRIASRIIATALAVAGLAPVASGQGPMPSSYVPLPSGDWTATHSLESGLGLKGSPAEIVANQGDTQQGLLVTVTAIANRSDKSIASVRFGWFIYASAPPHKVLASGQSAAVGLEHFGPGKVTRLAYPAARFAEAMEPCMQNGTLSGEYNIEVAVIEARFADGTIWKQNLASLGLPAARPN